MPSESNPKNNPENNLFVMGLRTRMGKGLNLEQAIKDAEEEIESSKAYDSGYLQAKVLLEEAANYLRSLEKK